MRERERASVHWRGRERGRENHKQALHHQWGLNSQTVRSWPEPKLSRVLTRLRPIEFAFLHHILVSRFLFKFTLTAVVRVWQSIVFIYIKWPQFVSSAAAGLWGGFPFLTIGNSAVQNIPLPVSWCTCGRYQGAELLARSAMSRSDLLDKTELFPVGGFIWRKFSVRLEKRNTGLGGLRSIFCSHYEGSCEFLKSNSAILISKKQHNVMHLGNCRRSLPCGMHLLIHSTSAAME